VHGCDGDGETMPLESEYLVCVFFAAFTLYSWLSWASFPFELPGISLSSFFLFAFVCPLSLRVQASVLLLGDIFRSVIFFISLGANDIDETSCFEGFV